MRSVFGLISLLLIPAGLASAGMIYDSYNIGLPLQDDQNGDLCCVFGPIEDIGWYYTPSTSYTLTQIETIFDTLGTDRTITFAVFTNTPADGGTLLGSATFETSEGTLGGPVFTTGIPLTGGTTYFIGLENIDGLGVDQVTYESTGVEGTPVGSVALGTAWVDDGGAQFGTEGCSDLNNWFCKPEIEFLGPSIPTSAPEPSTLLMMLGPAALAALWQVRRVRSAS